MTNTIRAKVDNELTRRVGTWFTVREIQDKLQINPSTLKPLIMKYAREKVLRRRHVKGTARSVQFSPAAANQNSFKQLLVKHMPYRNLLGETPKKPIVKKMMAAPKTKASVKKAPVKKKVASKRK